MAGKPKPVRARVNEDAKRFLPPDLMRYADHVNLLMSRIIRMAAMGSSKAQDGFVPLHADIMDEELGHRVVTAVLGRLIQNGYLERNTYYVKGRQSYMYRIGPQISHIPIDNVNLTDRHLLKRIREHQKSKEANWDITHRHAKKIINQIEIVGYEEVLETIRLRRPRSYNSAVECVEAIKNKDAYSTYDEYGRMHTAVTRLNRFLRPFLQFKGERLVGVDVGCSQPLILAAAMVKDIVNGKDDWKKKTKKPITFWRYLGIINIPTVGDNAIVNVQSVIKGKCQFHKKSTADMVSRGDLIFPPEVTITRTFQGATTFGAGTTPSSSAPHPSQYPTTTPTTTPIPTPSSIPNTSITIPPTISPSIFFNNDCNSPEIKGLKVPLSCFGPSGNSTCEDVPDREIPPDLQDYKTVCESGQLYVELMREVGWADDKTTFKKEAWFWFLYGVPKSRGWGKDYDPDQHAFCRFLPDGRSPSKRAVQGVRALTALFRKRWPNVDKWIRFQKRLGDGALAKLMQRTESKIIIAGVVGHLAKKHKDIPFATIHDSIFVRRQYYELIVGLMRKKFNEHDINPKLVADNNDTISTEEVLNSIPINIPSDDDDDGNYDDGNGYYDGDGDCDDSDSDYIDENSTVPIPQQQWIQYDDGEWGWEDVSDDVEYSDDDDEDPPPEHDGTGERYCEVVARMSGGQAGGSPPIQ